jgi:hypothetical protein
MVDRYDPRESWIHAGSLFVGGLVFVIDLSRPAGLLDSGLWIPLLYAVVPVVIGFLASVRTRASTGRRIPPGALVGLALWGLVGAVIALVIAVVVGLGRPMTPDQPSAPFGLLTGLLTYLVPTAAFAGLYAEAGRRPRRKAVALAVVAPVVATVALATLVRLSY